MSRKIRLGQRYIGLDDKPFIVAEMSGNHNSSLERAINIVDAAASAGADAIKLQTYTADSLTLDINEGPFFINDPKSLWYGKSLYELYREAATPYEWHEPILRRCRELGIECFSTPFDLAAVEFLERLDMPAYKIASFENTDHRLIKAVARTGKPVIISTGMANLSDISGAVSCAKEAGCEDLILLKCTSSYPASPIDSNLRTIPHMRESFGVEVGLSDHTMGIGAAVASVALGATFIEKHFTLSRADGGVDSAFSMEPHELKALVEESQRAWEALGAITYKRTPSEEKSLKHRRSIVAIRDISSGEKFTEANIASLRPGHGLSPVFYEQLIGRTCVKPIKRGEGITWDSL